MRTLLNRLEALEHQEGPADELALIWPANETDRFHWQGHVGTFTMDEIKVTLKPGGRVLIWDLPGSIPQK